MESPVADGVARWIRRSSAKRESSLVSFIDSRNTSLLPVSEGSEDGGSDGEGGHMPRYFKKEARGGRDPAALATVAAFAAALAAEPYERGAPPPPPAIR